MHLEFFFIVDKVGGLIVLYDIASVDRAVAKQEGQKRAQGFVPWGNKDEPLSPDSLG